MWSLFDLQPLGKYQFDLSTTVQPSSNKRRRTGHESLVENNITLPKPSRKRRTAPTKETLLADLPPCWSNSDAYPRVDRKINPDPTVAELLNDPVPDIPAAPSPRAVASKVNNNSSSHSSDTTRSTSEHPPSTSKDVNKDDGSAVVDLRRMQKKLRKEARLRELRANWSQQGPELPDEFSRDIQNLMNRITADRTDPIRAKVFENMISQVERHEQPQIPPPVRVIPHISEACPDFNFVYTSRVVYPPDSQPLQSHGCSCPGGRCPTNGSCSCYQRQSDDNARYNEPDGFAYDERGRLRFQPHHRMAIWECNDQCGCGPECPNRMVGKGRQVPLDLVRTNQCGWGVRLGPVPNPKPGKKGKVPAGTFMGVYSGELINIEEARRREKLYANINLSYLFDLDFASLGKNEHLKTFEEEGFCFLSSTAQHKQPQNEEGLAPSAPQPHMHAPDDTVLHAAPGEPPDSDDEEYNTYQALWSVDAFHVGNISRFFNHNCQPNCMLRCCYVNEGDPTKPLLGIFAIKTIYTGDEITLSYSGQLNLDWDQDGPLYTEMMVNDARAYREFLDMRGERNCWCSAPRCTGNMFLAEPEDETLGAPPIR